MGDIERLQLRISDADRHQVAEILRQAAGEGRLDFEELDERLEATYQAKTYADLVPITVDLPVEGGANASAAVAAAAQAQPSQTPGALDVEPERHLAILGGFERKGVWTVPPAMSIVAVLGGADLDLRRATFAATSCELTVTAVMGGVNLVVPPDVRVIFSMASVLGGHNDDKGNATASADAPTLVIKGLCLLGGVNVSRKTRKELGSA